MDNSTVEQDERSMDPRIAIVGLYILTGVLLVAALLMAWYGRRPVTVIASMACAALAVVVFLGAETLRTACAPAQARYQGGARTTGVLWGAHSWHEPTLADCLGRLSLFH